MRRYECAGGTAVVTGAASGIGAALARALAGRDSDLVLLDRDGDRLDAVAAGIRREHPAVAVDAHLVDLADAAAVERVAGAVRDRHPRVRLLVNNAGVALGGRFEQLTPEEFGWVIDINFRAVVLLTHALLPALKAEPGAHLVNVSSLFGLVAPAGQTAYAASKFAVRGFTEALRPELAEHGIGVTCVHPGGVRTRIAESARVGSGVSREEYDVNLARWAKLLTIDPDRAAQVIVRGVQRRRSRVLIGWSARVPDLLARLLPASAGPILSAATTVRPGRVVGAVRRRPAP